MRSGNLFADGVGTIAILLVIATGSLAGAQETSDKTEKERERAREKYCASLPKAERLKIEMCSTEEERQQEAERRRQAAIADKEKPSRSRFPHWLHLDTLWIPSNLNERTYGLIGAHVTVANLDRVYFYGPPGFMLLMEDNGVTRRYRPALTWGVSLFLFDSKPPGTQQRARLFLNVSKVWTTTTLDATTGYRNGRDLAGLSMTWKRP